MEYLVCPEDGAQLKATPGRRDAEGRLVVECPQCVKRFAFGPGGLNELPPELDPESK